jgi:hypothetical protein
MDGISKNDILTPPLLQCGYQHFQSRARIKFFDSRPLLSTSSQRWRTLVSKIKAKIICCLIFCLLRECRMIKREREREKEKERENQEEEDVGSETGPDFGVTNACCNPSDRRVSLTNQAFFLYCDLQVSHWTFLPIRLLPPGRPVSVYCLLCLFAMLMFVILLFLQLLFNKKKND